MFPLPWCHEVPPVRNSLESFSSAHQKGVIVLVGLLIFHLFFKAYGADDQEADSIDASEVVLHVNGTDPPDLSVIRDGADAKMGGDSDTGELGEGKYINPAILRSGSDTKKFQLNSEDSDAPELVVTPTTIDPFPEGEARSFTVKLSAAPSGDVTVRLTEDAANIVSVSLNKTELTFTTTNWNTTQTVTVTHTDDNAITGDGRVVIDLAPSGEGVTESAQVELLFKDNDKPELVVLPTTQDPLLEGKIVKFTLKLSKEPSGNVSVTVWGSFDDRISGPRRHVEKMKFTKDNWERPREYFLAFPEDDIVTGDFWYYVYLEPHGGGMNKTQTVQVPFRLVDNDKRKRNFTNATGFCLIF